MISHTQASRKTADHAVGRLAKGVRNNKEGHFAQAQQARIWRDASPGCLPLKHTLPGILYSAQWQKFQSRPQPDKVFFLWGHSYEFDQDNNWDLIETFARHVSIEDTVWHATNIKFYEYIMRLAEPSVRHGNDLRQE